MTTTTTRRDVVATVVVPAHNEELGIRRLLDALAPTGGPTLRVIVAANGCSDRTADVVRAHGSAEVLELAEGNKQKAMRAGAAMVDDFPIVYADADVVVSAASVAALAEALDGAGLLAAAPRRHLDLDGSSRLVRSYYAVWTALPQVRSGLFGRGVIALSEEGQRRIEGLPMYLSDDLALSESFAPDERAVIESATVRIVCPRAVSDLVRRRQRVIQGTRQFDARTGGQREQTGTGGQREQTSARVLLQLLRARPGLAVHLPAFLGVTVAARLALRARERRGASQTWLRDESSRRG